MSQCHESRNAHATPWHLSFPTSSPCKWHTRVSNRADQSVHNQQTPLLRTHARRTTRRCGNRWPRKSYLLAWVVSYANIIYFHTSPSTWQYQSHDKSTLKKALLTPKVQRGFRIQIQQIHKPSSTLSGPVTSIIQIPSSLKMKNFKQQHKLYKNQKVSRTNEPL